MTQSSALKLTIETTELAKFCDKLIKRSRDIAKTHDALITLEAFISVFARQAHGSKEYNAIERLVKSYTEQTRTALLHQQTKKLLSALQQQNIAAITQIHTPMSRNGFYQILKTVIGQLSTIEIFRIRPWAMAWIRDAKQQAEQASGYPEAYDFKQAGISVEEFQAMEDVGRFLGNY